MIETSFDFGFLPHWRSSSQNASLLCPPAALQSPTSARDPWATTVWSGALAQGCTQGWAGGCLPPALGPWGSAQHRGHARSLSVLLWHCHLVHYLPKTSGEGKSKKKTPCPASLDGSRYYPSHMQGNFIWRQKRKCSDTLLCPLIKKTQGFPSFHLNWKASTSASEGIFYTSLGGKFLISGFALILALFQPSTTHFSR